MMNRREFAKWSAMAAAGMRASSMWATQKGMLPDGGGGSNVTDVPYPIPLDVPGKPVGYALVGLGTICDIFGRATLHSKSVKVTALVTGEPDSKGMEWAARYGVPKSSIYTYAEYDRLRDNPDVDAVYIGLPNSMHCEYTVRAAKAGKHVLCEKPMAISSAECRTMIDACRAANRRLMIAYRCHYEPTHLAALKLVRSGAIGKIEAFEGGFGFDAPAHKTFWRLDKKLAGGGPIFDVGIYPLNDIRLFTGEEPADYKAFIATRDHASGRFAQVEQTMDWTMKMPSGIVATVATSYGENMPGFLRIHGDKGALEYSPSYGYTGTRLRSISGPLKVDVSGPTEQTYEFQLEAEHFAHCVRTGETPWTPGEEGLKDMLAIEAIYRAAGAPLG